METMNIEERLRELEAKFQEERQMRQHAELALLEERMARQQERIERQ